MGTLSVRQSVVTIIVCAVFMVSSLANGTDEVDLSFVYEPIPKETNGFPMLLDAIQAFEMPDAFHGKSILIRKATPGKMARYVTGDMHAYYRVYDWCTGDAETVNAADLLIARTFLSRNKNALAIAEKALLMKRIQVPEPKTLADKNAYLSPMRSIARAMCVRAKLRLTAGQQEAAFKDYLSIIRFGRKLKGGDGDVLAYLVAVAIEAIGESAMFAAIGSSRLSPKMLKALSDALNVMVDDRPMLIRSLLAERRALLNSPRDIVAYTFIGLFFLDSPPGFTFSYDVMPPFLSLLWMIPGFYHHEDTMTLMDAWFRLLVKSINAKREPKEPLGPLPSQLVLFNFCGRLMVKSAGMYSKIGAKSRSGRTRKQFIRLALCLKAYHQVHGRLPATLNELVKEKYLKEIPDDPFGPGKIRYSSKRGILYCVGMDGEDQGGTPLKALGTNPQTLLPNASFRKEKDPTCIIPFGRVAKPQK